MVGNQFRKDLPKCLERKDMFKEKERDESEVMRKVIAFSQKHISKSHKVKEENGRGLHEAVGLGS